MNLYGLQALAENRVLQRHVPLALPTAVSGSARGDKPMGNGAKRFKSVPIGLYQFGGVAQSGTAMVAAENQSE
jgi:hypothetical protein